MRPSAGEVERVLDRIFVGKIADDQNDGRIFGPDRLRHWLEFPPVIFVDLFLVAELEILQAARRGMTIGDTLASPFTIRRTVDVFDEVRLSPAASRPCSRPGWPETGRLAEIQKVEDAPTVRGVRIPPTLVGRTVLARPDHFLPAILRRVGHATAVASS